MGVLHRQRVSKHRVRTLIVDALQVPAEFSGVGRQALAIGAQLAQAPPGLALELRCAAETLPLLSPVFPPGTHFSTPIRRSRPRLLRILYQQVVAPLRDSRSSLVVCLGDQGPLWGRAATLLIVNDVRRLRLPQTAGPLERSFYRLLVPRALRHAGHVATISAFSQSEIEALLGPRQRVSVVAHHPPPRVPRPDAERGRHLLLVGALRPYKRIETAVEALALLAAHERPPLVIVGPSEGRWAQIAALAGELGVDGQVEHRGWVGERELERLYRSAAATVSGSSYEGYGLSVGESLSYGTPTIASDIPAHREVGGDAVLYFRPGDAQGLADRIREALDPGRAPLLARHALERSVSLGRESSAQTFGALILAAVAEPNAAGQQL